MKVLVIDSTALSDCSERYRSYFPRVKLRGIEPSSKYAKQKSGPHGYQCGYYAGVLLNEVEGDHEIVYARIFDEQGAWIRGSENFVLDVIWKEKPDVVSCSWGMDDGDSPWGEKAGFEAWHAWAQQFKTLQRDQQFVAFFAAGNDDRNDADNDVAFPARNVSDFAVVVGAHTRGGKPSRFSGDGKGVQVAMWGENVPLLNGDGYWDVGSGTSFACPKAAGLCAVLQTKYAEFVQYAEQNCTTPKDWKGELPHPKWGWGSLEYRYQEYMAELPEEIKPPRIPPKALVARYVDRERVHDSIFRV